MDESFEEFMDRSPDDEGWNTKYEAWYEDRISHYMEEVATEFANDINAQIEDGIPILEARIANLESHIMSMLAERDVIREMEFYEAGIPMNPEPTLTLIRAEEEEEE